MPEHGSNRCLLLLLLVLLEVVRAGAVEYPNRLFVETSRLRALNSASATGVDGGRVRLAHIDPEVLQALKTPGKRSARLILNFFGDTTPAATLFCVETAVGQSTIWRGYAEGFRGSQVLFAIHGNALAGSVTIPGSGAFQIQQAANEQYRIVEVDPDAPAPCEARTSASAGSGPVAMGPTASTRSISKAGPGDDPPEETWILDLLVVYTAAAREGAGAADGIRAVIDTAVAEANLALENSRVSARLRLVQAAEIDYVESASISTDLEELTEDDDDGPVDDGRVHGVHQLRAQYQADLVCMFTEGTGTTIGLANIMHEVHPDFAKYAFSVVRRQFANTYFTLAHEAGHNLGCQHDRAHANGGGVFPFSYGYRFVVNGTNYRDVMASQSGGGIPIAYYSNPAVEYLGAPTGIPESSSQSANSAKTLCLTAQTAAGFRAPALSTRVPVVALTSPVNQGIYSAANPVTCSAAANDPDGRVVRVEFFADDTLIGVATNEPFTIRWSNPTLGRPTLTARAVDELGASALSSSLSIELVEPVPTAVAEESRFLDDGRFQLHVTGAPGQRFRVDGSADATRWTPIATNALTGNSLDFVDGEAPDLKERFYRVVPLE